MFCYKAIGQSSTSVGCYAAGSIWAKPLKKSVKRNKRVMTKSRPPNVETVGSGKSQHPLNKRMLPFLETAIPRA